jgi:catechol 2,3-dioxygenase-like lactoylglutathione lyase family enzyme
MRLHHIESALIVVPDLEAAIAAYTFAFGYRVIGRGDFPEALALDYGQKSLAFAPSARVGRHSSQSLQFVESKSAAARAAFDAYGWMALEILVRDVDQLAGTLPSAFRVLEPPKNLDFTDAIRAMQVLGPGDEILYLTEVKRTVPGFNLPLSSVLDAPAGGIFIAVQAVQNRALASAFYQGLGACERTLFEARLSAFNRAHHLPAETKHQLATVAFASSYMLELDEPSQGLKFDDALRLGILSVHIARRSELGQAGDHRLIRGPNHEWIELD